ncbi:MAG: CbtA family protein [Alphaproteobacteria bacterium]|nr:CbtA family protein [Alphaproteobacteria bacterium]
MFARILTSALLSGAVAGLVAGLLQWYFVQPILLQAELYESGRLVHFGTKTAALLPDTRKIDWVRDSLSLMFTLIIYVGYGLILVSLMAMVTNQTKIQITPHNGILWGLTGYGIAHLAPAFSLAPEIPGVAAADVFERQLWWFATIAVTALAVGLLVYTRPVMFKVIAVVLLLTPHVIGAPHPEVFTGSAPPEIAALFVARSLGVELVAWLLLGVFSAYFWVSENDQEAMFQRK